MANSSASLGVVFIVITVLAFLCNFVSIFVKLLRDFTIPKLWRYSLLHQDLAHLCLSVGLFLFWIQTRIESETACQVAGVFLTFGLLQCVIAFLTTEIILLLIQNPGKSTSLSSFHRNVVTAIITPGVVISGVLASLPYVSDGVFNKLLGYDVDCFPIRSKVENGRKYGIILIVLLWITCFAIVSFNVVLILKLWKFNNRINSAQNNIWQTQHVTQGKLLTKFLSVNHGVTVVFLLTTTVSIYSQDNVLSSNSSWIVLTSLALFSIIHGLLSNICDVMWTSCCCKDTTAVKEPHRKLKKLELINVEAPGKLRMKATWTVGKNATKRGMMKVYGVHHLKSWAQEIVMLGMLRKTQHPSLIQCLWTSSSNPYYETMTLISGEIITSDSRIICLELTNGGTLRDFLQKAELPLPEPCQRMIVHDVAEGLFYLHHENILHNNLNSSCIYLKGSLQSMVLRAAVGDFEDAEIYGTLQQSLDNSTKDKRYFFLPDIRSFALIALELVSKMCEKKFQNRYVNYNSDHVPMKMNLTGVISDEDDEFEAQYCYDVAFEPSNGERCFSPDFNPVYRNDSLENLIDKERPTSPNYFINPNSKVKVDRTISYSSDENDDEVAIYNEKREVVVSESNRQSQSYIDRTEMSPGRRKSPEIKSKKHGVTGKQRSKRDENVPVNRVSSPQPEHSNRKQVVSPVGRCLSPDPMKDEKLQELRKEMKKHEKETSKSKKSSILKKKAEENGKSKSGQVIEAFVSTENEKRKDGSWKTKPTSILKSITGNGTVVSTFHAKQSDQDSGLHAIEEEDINPVQSYRRKTIEERAKEKQQKAEVWDIIDEQYYTQVNKKAMKNLRKTISAESRSSLWSFISTHEDLDYDSDALEDILECLPGMTEPSDLRKAEVTVKEIMAEREKAETRQTDRQRFSLKDLPKSRFELIDYYEMLKRRQITMNDVPEDKREMLLNVVELKREERNKKEGHSTGAILSDEMYDNGMNPGSSKLNEDNMNGKIKVVSFRKNQCHSSPQRSSAFSSGEERAKSAPLKRPRTPKQKQIEQKQQDLQDFGKSAQNETKRNKARTALKRALNSKGQIANTRQIDRAPKSTKQDFTLKYATVKKINVASANELEQSEDTLVLPVPSFESFSVRKENNPPVVNIKRFSSFSSNESAISSVTASESQNMADVSLASGEVSSLSSQAESDNFETDGHMTDVEGPSRQPVTIKRKLSKASSSRIDSGFDSGSMSSEMSETIINRNKQKSAQNSKSNGMINSWARNYKMVDPISHSPYHFSSKFLPPVSSLPEEQFVDGTGADDNNATDMYAVKSNKREGMDDKDVIHNHESIPKTKIITVSKVNKKGSHRALSPEQYMRPASRPLFSPGKAVPDYERPMSPNVQPTHNRPIHKLKSTGRPMSPPVRALSPGRKSDSRPFSPVRCISPVPVSVANDAKQNSEKVQEQVIKSGQNILKVNVESTGIGNGTSKAAKRYRELIKQGVPLRESVVEASHDSVNNDDEGFEFENRPGTAESTLEEPMDDQELYADLNAKGFFASRSRSPSPFKMSSPSRCKIQEGKQPGQGNRRDADRQRRRKKDIPLDQIVREEPDTEKRKAHRSRSNNHLAVSEDVFLNQPTSEDSETCSIKTTKSNNSVHCGSQPKLVVDAELVIDRIFSQKSPHDPCQLDVEVEAALGLDKDPMEAMNSLYSQENKTSVPDLDAIPLLNGVCERHIHGCIELATHMHVLTVRDLLPATNSSFDTLRNKLHQVGQLGTVGHQLLDIIHKCWLLDMPPTSGDLVEQLTDPITETEL